MSAFFFVVDGRKKLQGQLMTMLHDQFSGIFESTIPLSIADQADGHSSRIGSSLCAKIKSNLFIPGSLERVTVENLIYEIEMLMKAPMEIEAKFAVPDPSIYWQLQTIQYLAGYELSTHKLRNVRDTYLDARQRPILAAGYSCRRRCISRQDILITVKSLEKAKGAIHQRQEYQIALDSILPPAEWPDSEVRTLILQLINQEPLEELFELQQTRIIRMLQLEGRVLAEFSLDRVSLISNETELVYHELEVELLPSTPEQILIAIGDYLQNEWRLQPAPQSKFERALALLDTMPKRAVDKPG